LKILVFFHRHLINRLLVTEFYIPFCAANKLLTIDTYEKWIAQAILVYKKSTSTKE
jgi:hypothetical protein